MSEDAPPPIPHVRNVKPHGRSVKKNKEEIEKERLKARGGYGDDINDPFAVSKDAAGFLDSAQQFHTDVMGDQAADRQRKMEKERKKRQALAESAAEREARLVLRQEQAEQAETEALKRIQADPNKGRANVQSVPYNVVTMQYADNLDGKRLEHHDQRAVYSSKQRTRKMQQMDNPHGYNPITGGDVDYIPEPERPKTPEELRGKNKY